MEVDSRGSSLKRQLAEAFSFTEDSVPEMKRRDSISGNDSGLRSNPFESLLFEASFKIPSRPRSKPSSNPERRVKRDTMPPVTPSKTESQAANSENEVQEETNSVHTKQKRKKYKPKVVSDGASSKKPTKSPGNSKSVASDLKSKNATAPITSDLKSQCPRVPITPEPKLATHEVPTEFGTKLTTPETPVSCEPKPTHHEVPLSVDSIPQLKRVQVTPAAEYLNAEAHITPHIAPDLTCMDSETAVQSDLKPENISFTNAAGLKIENLEAPITPDPKSHTLVKKKRGRPFGTKKKTNDPKLHTLVKKKRGRPFGTNKKTTKTDLGLENPSSGVQLNSDAVTKPTKSVRRQLNFGAENYTEKVSNEEIITAANPNPDNSIINLNSGDANEHQQPLQQGVNCDPEAENKPVVHEENTSVTTKSADCSTDNATDLNCPNLVKPVPPAVNGLNFDLTDNLEADMHGGMCIDPDLKLNKDDTEIVVCLMDVIDRVGFKDYLINLAAQRTKGVKRGRPKQSPKLNFDEMLEEIVLKMTHLKLYENALVLYQERKEKYRGIVALDEDSLKEWNILMGEGSNSAPENPEREEKWRKERDTFRNLAEWFIAKMKLIQGDRCFSEWKGSVVDSVVGAFLTQNVSDQLSSSAFISLCARYPRRQDVNVTCPEKKFPDSEEKKSQAVNEQGCASDIGDPHIDGVPREVLKDSLNLELTKEIRGSPEVQKSNVSKKNGYKIGMEHIDWDALRKEAYLHRHTREGRSATEHAADWDAVRQAETIEVAKAIHGRGQDNVLAERIQNFLNRVVKEHGSMDLEWLRDIPGDQAKEYLLSIYGLGLKSVECVRLLTLHQVAFPVDTNVGRIAVRLGWVPLQPLPESVQMHLLEMYPVMDSIQKYLWPRLCKLDQETLYELHYQMITFGKVFCTKSKPNCNACPLRSDCKHFASAFASARLMLPGPQENQDNKVVRWNGAPTAFENTSNSFFNPANVPTAQFADVPRSSNSEPIIEEPMTPEEEQRVEEIPDIEDLCFDNPDEIPTINLNMESFVRNIEEVVKNNDSELQIEDISKALVLLPPIAASVPPPILKHSRHLRTVHEAYEIPDGHPILRRLKFEERNQADPSPYLLILYSPEKGIDWKPCGCNSCKEVKRYHFPPEDENKYVKCTFTIPCRTAMRGSFPLNGTYFQVNEVFADHCTARNPIMVPRDEIWRLRKRFVYFGSTVSSILKGLPTEEIQHCFWRGFVCVREFDRMTRYPKPLSPWLHLLPTVRRKIGSTQ